MVCGVPSSSFLLRGTRFSLSFPGVWEGGCQVLGPASPAELSRSGSKSLSLQIRPRIPKASFPS